MTRKKFCLCFVIRLWGFALGGHSAESRRGFGHLANSSKEMNLFSSFQSEINRSDPTVLITSENKRTLLFSIFDIDFNFGLGLMKNQGWWINVFTEQTFALQIYEPDSLWIVSLPGILQFFILCQKLPFSHTWLVRLLISGNWES